MSEFRVRHLIVVLGDQLDPSAAAFDGCDPACDVVWMAEVAEESTHVWSTKMRTALFLSAMRHFAQDRRADGWTVDYRTLDDPGNRGALGAELAAAIARLRPQTVRMTAPGDWRVLQAIRDATSAAGVQLVIEADRHFYCDVRAFAAWARGQPALRLETFYRHMRHTHRVLMDGDAPAGDRWNFDTDNRAPFEAQGPGAVPGPPQVEPDAITREVLDLVRTRLTDHPGSLDAFAWPVTRAQALHALERFIDERLPAFGRWQDALWPDAPWLWHSQIASALNLKLLHPREVVDAAEAAWRAGRAPLAAAEGYIRQILGWREYVRGVYWTQMPRYADTNALQASGDLPGFYWTGDTPMPCLADALRQTLDLGYAHHIQRLMVIGLYAQLLGVEPAQVHHWFLAVYVDAVEWVEMPNVLGMSQFADGGLMSSKPYIASGRYIERMSAGSYCRRCPFDPGQRTGPQACPYTRLYWDFMLRHEALLVANPRTAQQVRSLERLDATERALIREEAAQWRRDSR
ncbi:cryptochrome/photolyase family protein [Luteimonas terrae]|uniref:Deoxyribodipyrimidine photolyase-related protein n=1 Tax=Luteimonas terrae TaxID=1530191 RepID=A0ABU1XXJ7_9GAMM|nr:cryptochrome/photolyase family protein [Luteimonas terrae]MDR7193318.1 deoxyribodipyrimidine photolyase-related protein [Luteimonas terrae]